MNVDPILPKVEGGERELLAQGTDTYAEQITPELKEFSRPMSNNEESHKDLGNLENNFQSSYFWTDTRQMHAQMEVRAR